jgi:hypothetical protein
MPGFNRIPVVMLSFNSVSDIRKGSRPVAQDKFTQKLQRKTTGTGELMLYRGPDKVTRKILQKYYREFINSGGDFSPDLLNELDIAQIFLSSHVKPSYIHDIPCMLLWAEWIRFFLKKMNTFPKFICEEEFMNLIIQSYGKNIIVDDGKGLFYSGIKFIPGKIQPPGDIKRSVAKA